MIGNAVPVNLAKFLALEIKSQILANSIKNESMKIEKSENISIAI